MEKGRERGREGKLYIYIHRKKERGIKQGREFSDTPIINKNLSLRMDKDREKR